MRAAILAALLAGLLTACSSANGDGDVLPVDSTGLAPEPIELDYEVFLLGAMPDTLRGAAYFGQVVDAQSNQTVSVVRMETGFDFGGGFFITYGGEAFPQPGQYSIAPFPADSIRARGLPAGFSVRYRRGLLINLRATGGTFTLETVNDTLIAGRFEADLAGLLALPGGRPREGTLRALGRFEAEAKGAGYIIGF